MKAGDAFAMSAEVILSRLLAETGASRTTLRLDEPILGFAMVEVVAEALAPGQASMRGESTIDHRAAATGLWLEANRRLLVQADLLATDFPAPTPLVQGFGVRAQMLAPIERDGRLEGWISVHQAGAPRHWAPADERAATAAASEIAALLGDPAGVLHPSRSSPP